MVASFPSLPYLAASRHILLLITSMFRFGFFNLSLTASTGETLTNKCNINCRNWRYFIALCKHLLSCFFTAAAPAREPVFVCCQSTPSPRPRSPPLLFVGAVLVHVGRCDRRDLDGLVLWFEFPKQRNMADRLTQLQDAVNQVLL